MAAIGHDPLPDRVSMTRAAGAVLAQAGVVGQSIFPRAGMFPRLML